MIKRPQPMTPKWALGLFACGSFMLTIAGMVLFLAGELSGHDWLAILGGWLTVPFTALMGFLVLAVVLGYACVAIVTVGTYVLSAVRRYRRG